MKKKVNLWRSIYTGTVYQMELDWLPQYGGYDLLGTIFVIDE